MNKYIVLSNFKDGLDNEYVYNKNDIYPREGLEPSKERIKELSSKKNKSQIVLIKKVVE